MSRKKVKIFLKKYTKTREILMISGIEKTKNRGYNMIRIKKVSVTMKKSAFVCIWRILHGQK